MDRGIFKFILRYSLRQQVMLLAVTAVSLPVLYFYLELPKTIVNEALSSEGESFAYLGMEMERLPFLMLLSGLFLAMVLINGGLKYFINVYRGIMAERMLRRFRYMLITRMLRFRQERFRNVSGGEVVATVVQETEPVGGFFGEAISLPAFQGGTLLTILVFMFIQDPVLGVAAISLYPIQAYLIPKLQRKVNRLTKLRVATARKMSERIGETVDGAREVHMNGTAQFELADFGDRLGRLFDIRKDIYKTKFFIKFLNNFINQLTPFFFFSIGGYLVIEGDLTIGALVAVLAAYKDISAPWKELLTYYQRMEDSRIKYGQLVELYEQPDLLVEQRVDYPADGESALDGALTATNLTVVEEDGSRVVDGVSLTLQPGDHAALLGSGASGRTELAQAMMRLLDPSRGQVTLGTRDLAEVPDPVLGRHFAYLDQESFVRSGTIGDNLFYGLMQGPPEAANDADEKLRWERQAAGNSPFAAEDDWLGGGPGHGDLTRRAVLALRQAGLEEDVFHLGLRRVVDPADLGDMAARILEARVEIHRRVASSDLADTFEIFKADTYNGNASVSENILFGAPLDDSLAPENLATNPVMRQVLADTGLDVLFVEKGAEIAALMVDIFSDLPPGHEFFERFSFIEQEDLAEYKRQVSIVQSKGIGALEEAERTGLTGLVFKLVPSKHRLGILDDTIQDRLLEARRRFAESLPDGGAGLIAFYDIQAYNPAGSICDNLLFGRVAEERGDAMDSVSDLLVEVIENMGLYNRVVEIGLESDVGVGGRRLSATQRQKLSIARALLKRPAFLVLNEALSVFDTETRQALAKDIRTEMTGRGLIWAANDLEDGVEPFPRTLHIANGRLREETADGAALPAAEPTPVTAKDDAADSGLKQEAEVLRQVPFFEGMSASDLKLLAFTSERVNFPEGGILMRQGELGEFAYVIIDGEADVIVLAGGQPRTVAVRRKGDLVGELALLTEAPRTATLRARVPVQALRLRRDVFFKLIEETPQLNINLLRIISRRFEAMIRDMGGGTQLYDTETRLPNRENLKGRLRDLASDPVHAVLLVRIPVAEVMAGILGASREHRLFRKLTRRLRGVLGEADILARLDRTEFALVMAHTPDSQAVADHIEAARTALCQPMTFGRSTYELHPVNIEITPLSVADAVALLDATEEAAQ